MIKTESPAVRVAKAHVEAWDRHDWDASRKLLNGDVRVTVTTTQPIMTPVDTTGVAPYMEGLTRFAQTVVPGSTRVIASTGDKHNAMLLVTSEAELPGLGRVDIPGARLYLIDDDGKIKFEQVLFYAADA